MSNQRSNTQSLTRLPAITISYCPLLGLPGIEGKSAGERGVFGLL